MSSSSGRSNEQYVEHPKVAELKRLRKIFYLKVKSHRDLFVSEFRPLIRDWRDRLPNLRDIFTKQEMDWLLEASIELHDLSQEIVDFVIRCGYKDEPDLDENGKPLLRRTTAVHQIDQCKAVDGRKIAALQNVFKIYDKFHVNYTNESGYTHFHMACKYGLDDVAEKFLELGQDSNCLVAETGVSALHLALVSGHKEVAKLLLKHGADPNLADYGGQTPLHVICESWINNVDLAELFWLFFKLCDDKRLPVKIDARDDKGNTPLHLAVLHFGGRWLLVELLLRRGANPTLADDEGQTPLHVICRHIQINSHNTMKTLLKICDEKHLPVIIDARDNEGNTPLHLTLLRGNAEVVELLLRHGADPNSVNATGLTPLHIIAKHGCEVEPFFSVIGDTQQTVQIDTRDNEGRTALEWAVASCSPPAVVSLLERGADVSGFVFPTASDSDQYVYRSRLLEFPGNAGLDRYCTVIKLAVATGLLAIVELLEPRVGHELDLGDALKVMGFFDKYRLYESADFSTTRDVDYLVDSIFKEMAEKSTYMDYFKFASSYKVQKLSYKPMKACALRLCEKVTRKFFRDWALDCFMELIHYRLPILCCDMIIGNLTNQDLYNICLAAKGQTDEQNKINVIKNVMKCNNEIPARATNTPKRLKIEF